MKLEGGDNLLPCLRHVKEPLLVGAAGVEPPPSLLLVSTSTLLTTMLLAGLLRHAQYFLTILILNNVTGNNYSILIVGCGFISV